MVFWVSAVTAVLTLGAAGIAFYVWKSMLNVPSVARSESGQSTHLDGATRGNPGPLATPESTAEIVKRVASGVFFITAYDALDQPIAGGTGCRVGDDRVATNRHVVENAVRVSVKQKDGTEFPVQGYCSYDTTRDVALMVVNGLPSTGHRFIAVGGADLVQGEQLTAIGHPQEFSFSVSDGIVSAIRETTDFPELYQAGLHANPDTRWIQSTAAISNGSSGGPLLNNRGELVGINTWIAGGQHLGFAVDAIHLLPLIESAGGQCHLFPLQDSNVIVTTEVAKLQVDFFKEYANLANNLRAAGSAEASRLVVQKQNPVPMYLEKLLRVIQDKPDTPQCWDAITAAHGIWATAAQLQGGHQYLRQIYAAQLDSKQIPFRALLSFSQAPCSIELERRLREVLDSSDSPQRTAAAGYALLSLMIAATDQSLTADIRLLKQRLIEGVSDQEVAGYPLHQLAEQVAAGHGNGAIGTLAPEIEGEDFTGETFRLSDYREKVILLDFWVDWCPHCRNMYPAERELVERMREQPFALLGVNSDQPQRARAVIDSGQVNWRSWVDSPPDSPIARQWSVESYPTMYLLDRNGVVRFKFEGAEDISSQIDFLMQESLLSMLGDVLAADSPWSYRDAAGIDDAPWMQINFDDSSWKRQQGPIAYNRPDTRGMVDEAWSKQIPATLLVRSRFELSDAAVGKPLIAQLRFNDAIVLYINGREVYRSNLADDAGLESPAAGIAGEEQHQGVYFPIPAQYLKAGENVISASVHQANEFSADLLFGLSLSSRVPDKTPILASENTSIIAAYCRMLSDLLPIDPYLADLKALVESPEPAVKLSAWWSAARGGKSLEMDWDSDPQMRQSAVVFAVQTLAGSLSQLMMKDLSGQDYRKLARNVHAGKSLLNAALPGNENIAPLADQTLAVAMYRIGRFQAALDLLTGSAISKQPSPTSIAYTALCYAKLNNQDEADKAVKRFLEMLKQPQWQHDEAASVALEELRLTFDLPESKPVIADVPVVEVPKPEVLQTDDSQRQVQSPEADPRIAERDRLRVQAMALVQTGKLDESKELFERVYRMEMSIFGNASEELDGTLDILIQIAEAQQDDQATIGIRQRKFEITEKRHGKNDYRSQDAKRAVADAKQRANFTPEQKARLQQADALQVQARLAYRQGHLAVGIQTAAASMALRKKVLGNQHPAYANSVNDLAALYHQMGDYLRAEPLYRQALAIREKVLGKKHPDYAASLNNLGQLYKDMGDYPQAEPLYREAMAIREKVLGKEHPDYAISLNSLAGLCHQKGDYPRAEPLYREAVEITLRNLEMTADVQSQRQQVRMGESLRYRLDNYLSLAVREPQFQPSAYAALLRWKGSVWQRQQRGRLLIDEPSLKPRFETLQQVSSKLSTLILRVPEPNHREAWRRQLDELTDEREKLERDLSLASVAFREASTPVTPKQMRDSLPDGTMLVDFLEYTPFTPANMEQQTKNSWERHLLVHLVRGDQEVRAIDLGPVDAIADLVQTWRRDLGGSSAAVDAAAQLRKRIWEPLAEHLSEINLVYVSPDGVLGQFPLAALPGKQPGSFLIEEIVILPMPQALTSMNQKISRADAAGEDRFCLVGGVDYDQVSSPTAPTQPTMPTSEPDVTGPQLLAVRGGEPMVFTPLPGTVGEIETIESLLQKHRPSARTTILSGAQASEAAFSRVAPGNRYLHIATHGFFAPATVQNALTASKPELMNRMLGGDQSRSPQLVGEHPDLLSGLVFAGANQHEPGADDGILTAAEVQSLDLRGVELAILSACETGLGKTAGGEGIIGLQRAFQLAGAGTTITSLWQVDDAATKALMVEFYENLFERKLGKYESLRQAQIWILNHPDAIKGRNLTRGSERETKITAETKTTPAAPTRSLPAYWAAFQLSGDPR